MATRTAKPPVEETTEEPSNPSGEAPKASIKDTVLEVLSELGITKASSTPVEEPEEEGAPVEEPETPRQTESRMRRAVDEAVGGLHIHLGQANQEPEKKAKEPEVVPGKPSKLAKFIGLAP